MKQTFRWLLLLLIPLLLTACPDPVEDELDNSSQFVADNIIGRWILSTSDAENWVVYEFTESSRILSEVMQRNYYETGSGYYSIEGNTVYGRYVTDRQQSFDIDWKVLEIKPFELEVGIYDNNNYVGQAQTYRILADESVEIGKSVTPAYDKISANKNVSGFKSLDPSVAKVDSATGEIIGINEGITFVIFTTSYGTAALKLTVDAKVKSFAELIVGTWVYDVPEDWEHFTFNQDGYVSVQWQTKDGIYDLDETGQGMYTISGETVSFTVNSTAGKLNMKFETESINDFDWTYRSIGAGGVTGKYTVQRVLESKKMSPEDTYTPNYQSYVGGLSIQEFKSHNETVAKVNANGMVTAVSNGRTYIDVVTAKGSGVIEIIVDGGVIPIAFQEMLGQNPSKVYEMLGNKPLYETSSIIYYSDYSPTIESIGISLDSWTGLVKGISVYYQPTINTDQVTSILEATFIPFMKSTTETYKAYMDTQERADASIGVTWNIPKLTLTYVNLAEDLFTDYSILMGMTRDEVINKMEREPDSSNEQMQAFFFFDNKGIAIVGAYYTDFEQNYNTVHSVVTMFDDTLSIEDITKYLKRKYPYFPEYSSDEELVFIPSGHTMEIYYMPKEKMVMYISTTNGLQQTTRANSLVRNLKIKSEFIR